MLGLVCRNLGECYSVVEQGPCKVLCAILPIFVQGLGFGLSFM